MKNKIIKEQVNLTEARRVGHFAELGDLNSKTLRSKRNIPALDLKDKVKTPIDQPIPITRYPT